MIVLLPVASCLDEPDCFQLNNNFVGISFKKIFDGKADTVAIVGITTPATDSIFYPFRLATNIQLELNPFEESTDFTLETLLNEEFLLDLGYKTSFKFISEDCGTQTILSGFAVNNHTFDSIKVVSGNLTNPPQINLEVYRCPRTNLLKLSFRKLVDGVEVADSVQLVNVTADYPVEFYFPTTKVPAINLPLNPNASSTQFAFEFIDGSLRTLLVTYAKEISTKYPRCAPTLIYDLVNSTSTFSEVISKRDSIQDPPITNFAIFK